jgi:hypothetical protein
VLGQGASLAVIQPHLKKLFAGIHRVRVLLYACVALCHWWSCW